MKKFSDAFRGLGDVLHHRAVLTQIFLGICAVIGGIIIKLDYTEWLAFVVCIFLVISAEIMNTAVEKIGDYLNEKYDERIKVIKDISAAAVLTASLGALTVCIMTVLRRLL